LSESEVSQKEEQNPKAQVFSKKPLKQRFSGFLIELSPILGLILD
jgi:hypothetical protein